MPPECLKQGFQACVTRARGLFRAKIHPSGLTQEKFLLLTAKKNENWDYYPELGFFFYTRNELYFGRNHLCGRANIWLQNIWHSSWALLLVMWAPPSDSLKPQSCFLCSGPGASFYLPFPVLAVTCADTLQLELSLSFLTTNLTDAHLLTLPENCSGGCREFSFFPAQSETLWANSGISPASLPSTVLWPSLVSQELSEGYRRQCSGLGCKRCLHESG